jgi:hypothetical protein
MKIGKITKPGKWIVIIGIALVLGAAGFVTYSVVDCLTTGCVNTNDQQHATAVRLEALDYAEQDCYKSYKQPACKQLILHDASFSCGSIGFCGWIVNIKSGGSFQYSSGLSLESSSATHNKYEVSTYYEANTLYTQNLGKIFESMCEDYKPTAKIGCNPTYISPTIDWLGNKNEDNNPSIGVAVSYVDPYQFEAKINRSGQVLGATITDYDVGSKVLYRYVADQ